MKKKVEGRSAKVLIAPLDWGLGHATRSIPIIRHLIKTGRKVIIAADGRPRKLLEAEFPDLQIVRLPGYDIKYPNGGSMASAMALQLPKIIQGIWREYRWLQAWAEAEHPSLIISDNRFGLFHAKIPSVYITHQLNIQTPERIAFLQPLLYRLHQFVIEKFTECWIPDYETLPGLAGKLSHSANLPVNARYIGPLSRFERSISKPHQINLYDENIDLLVILSGPEPQRSIFEEMIVAQLPKTSLHALVAEGRSEEDSDEWITDRVRVVSRLTSQDLRNAIARSAVILARPGYSTLMDMALIGKPVIFVPTPGQTEQEYLASLASQGWGCVVMQQKEFNLSEAWHEIQKVGHFNPPAYQPASFIPLLERLLNPASQ